MLANRGSDDVQTVPLVTRLVLWDLGIAIRTISLYSVWGHVGMIW